MKKLLLIIFVALFASNSAKAQLPDGSVAPDWTLTDLNGTSHNLYSLLDQGYTVFLDFSAVWCPPCWSYHQTHTLENLYVDHGPAGYPNVSSSTTDDVMVFMIEGDANDVASLGGSGANTQGDWITGTSYPIICTDGTVNNTAVTSAYSIGYWPTIYMICPDRLTTEVGQSSNPYGSVSACPPPASYNNDARTFPYSGPTLTCGDLTPEIMIQNYGLANLTSLTIDVTVNGSLVSSTPWSGNLTTYATQNVTLPMLSGLASNDVVSITVSLPNGVVDADPSNNPAVSFNVSMVQTTNVHLDVTVAITTDQYASETTWDIVNSTGQTVASGGPYSTSNSVQTPVTTTLNANECYFFTIYDSYGDGIDAGYGIGSFSVTDGNGTVISSGGQFTTQDGDAFQTGNGGSSTYGCTDPTADNYDPSATIDDGSCIYCTSLSVSLNAIADVSCSGMCDGYASAFANGGTAPYSYQWSNGQNGQTAGTLCAGSYYCQVTDANGCVAITAIVITEPPALSATLTTVQISVAGGNDGSITANVFGGTPPYNFLWQDQNSAVIGTGPIITGLVAGVYTCIVTDNFGCVVISISDFIIEPACNIISTLNLTQPLCFGNLALLSWNNSGGIAPYFTTVTDVTGITYVYTATNPGSVTLPEGVYTLSVIDAVGCQQFMNIQVIEPPELIVTLTSGNESSPGACDGWVTTSVSGVCAPYTYQWNMLIGGGVWISLGVTTPTLNGLCAGTYCINVTDCNGCVTTECVTITAPCSINGYISSVFPSNSSSCDGYAVVVPTTGIEPYTYQWTDTSGTIVSSSNLASSLCNSVYFVSVTDSIGCVYTDTLVLGTIYGCTDTAALNYNPYATVDDGSCNYPVIPGCTDTTALNYNSNANADDGSCLYCDIAVDLFVAQPSSSSACDAWIYAIGSSSYPPIQYAWNTGETTQFINLLCTGVYTVTLTDAMGCSLDTTIILGTVTFGCTDPTADNYDSTATIDDGSCTYTSVCADPMPTGLNVTDIVHNRVTINWDNMNDANCTVDQYRIKYRAVGTSSWSQKNMGTPLGSCTWPCNKTDKLILNLSAGTTYEYQMRAWYCGGSNSAWTSLYNFTTLDVCPNIGNLVVTTPTTTKATFTWDDSNGPYSFVRLKSRIDTIVNPSGSDWFNIGGAGVVYPTFTKDKNNLTPGESYRAQARTWCDPNGGPYKSDIWTSLVYWTMPTSIRIEGGESITHLDVYPNPSRDIFNISFTSEQAQNLKVRILNIIGEVLVSDELQQFVGEYTKQIDLTNNAKGIYFLEIETDNGVINKKLILQ